MPSHKRPNTNNTLNTTEDSIVDISLKKYKERCILEGFHQMLKTWNKEVGPNQLQCKSKVKPPYFWIDDENIC